jgi:uncharacterized membrane protein YeaQ/YmgE (transglycosylase-associated protein family)
MLMGIIGWILTGLIVGFIASKVADLKGDDPRLGIAVGAIGGVLGGWMYSLFSGSEVTAFNFWSIFFAAIAAVAAMLIWHIIRGRAAPIPYLNKRYR